MSNLGARSNVVCKISGIVAHVPGYNLEAKHLAPNIDHCLGLFGEDRVVFAGDWPTCLFNMPLRQWILTLKDIVKSRPFEEQKNYFMTIPNGFIKSKANYQLQF
jgi:predicted TIM-barrel fold metal-dependent hydrolase